MTLRVTKDTGYVFRKVVHLFLNSLFAITALLLPINWLIPVTIGAFIIVTSIELIRLRTSARKLVNTAFDPVLKKEEKGRFSSIFWAAFAIMLIAPVATPISLSYALACFAVADPTAALVGKYTKSRKVYKNKTVNGTFAFFFASFFVGILYLLLFSIGPWFILCSLLLATILSLVEVYSDPIDDNFSLVVIGTLLMRSLI